jgi:hypothetical protein
MYLFRGFILAVAVAVIGCSGETAVKVQAPAAPTGTAAAKAVLQEIAQSGQLGSGVMQLREGLEQLKQTDAAKGDALLADLKELEATSDPEQVKAKAQAMADKL